VLDALFFETVADRRQPQPCLCCRMPEDPADGRKDVAFHLNEGALLVSLAACCCEFLHCRHAIFGVFELGGDP
jgi:hypothetical protein